jgi:hypothetical protein
MIVPPRLPPEIKTVRPLVIAQAKRADGSAWTDAFRTLDEGRQALLDRAWISADFFLWQSIYVTPEAGVPDPYARGSSVGEAGMTSRSPLMDEAEGLSEADVALKWHCNGRSEGDHRCEPEFTESDMLPQQDLAEPSRPDRQASRLTADPLSRVAARRSP